MAGLIRSRVAWVTALLVLSLSIVEMPHLSADHHDADFDLLIVVHDGSAHHVGSGASEDSRPDHCLACHWGRAFRPGAESNLLDSPVVETDLARVPEQPFVPGRAPVAQPPLRSPPFASIPS